MDDGRAAGAISLRDRLLAEHAGIEFLLDEVIVAVEGGASAVVPWKRFSSALLAQIDAEDGHLVTALPDDRSARLLRHEHCYLRGRHSELGRAADRDELDAGALRDFRDVLRAHARNDDRLLYCWAETHLDERRRDIVFGALTDRLSTTSER
ncbi:MAG TPA: hypothetical protein VM925_29595 [Labilithrix sp.]|nr:hypothetical protein [Labilithrix sp.]